MHLLIGKKPFAYCASKLIKILLLPLAHDLQAILLFSQHPAWVHFAGKLTQNEIFCLNKNIPI